MSNIIGDIANAVLRSWLELGATTGGTIAHVAVMTLAQSAAYLESHTGTGPPSGLAEALRALSEIQEVYADPNIEGIIIRAEEEDCSRQVDVSEIMVVSDTNAANKAWVSDNAAPKPRTWTIRGKLMPTSRWVDANLIQKPTILAQLKLLDMYAMSRVPVWFKSFGGDYHRVQIQSIQHKWDPKEANAVTITVTLREYVALEVVTAAAGTGAGGAPVSFKQIVSDLFLPASSAGLITNALLGAGTVAIAHAADDERYGKESASTLESDAIVIPEAPEADLPAAEEDPDAAPGASPIPSVPTALAARTTSLDMSVLTSSLGTTYDGGVTDDVESDTGPASVYAPTYFRTSLPSPPGDKFQQAIVAEDFMLTAEFAYMTDMQTESVLLLTSIRDHYSAEYVVSMKGSYIPMMSVLTAWRVEIGTMWALYQQLYYTPLPGSITTWVDAWVHDAGLEVAWDNGHIDMNSDPNNPPLPDWDNLYAWQYGQPSQVTTDEGAWAVLVELFIQLNSYVNRHYYLLRDKAAFDTWRLWMEATAAAIKNKATSEIADLWGRIPTDYAFMMRDEYAYSTEALRLLQLAASSTRWIVTLTDSNLRASQYEVIPGVWQDSPTGEYRIKFEFNGDDVGYSDIANTSLLLELSHGDQ